jgi:dimethylhistidine N-methyltransferase
MSANRPEGEGKVEFARDVRAGLSRTDQKELPAKYLYDDLGSALFEAITHLPEYGLTRADDRLLARLSDELPDRLPAGTVIAELGSGSGTKTRRVLAAFANGRRPLYRPIDVSAAALRRCRQELSDVAEVEGFHSTYIPGLREATKNRPGGTPLLLLFLGSNIGNFDRFGAEDFLRDVRESLKPGDGLLLGVDLVKSLKTLLTAYDDPTGVTAAFNLNVLGRINRELNADFDLRQFRHEARYREDKHRIEMHLRSRRDQTVAIRAAGFRCEFREGETIWTEASHKFTLEELRGIASRTGFRAAAEWVDEEWAFAENLWVAGE